MDPDAVLAVLLDESADLEDRLDADDALNDWLANGGFLPGGYTRLSLAEAMLGAMQDVRRRISIKVSHLADQIEAMAVDPDVSPELRGRAVALLARRPDRKTE